MLVLRVAGDVSVDIFNQKVSETFPSSLVSSYTNDSALNDLDTLFSSNVVCVVTVLNLACIAFPVVNTCLKHLNYSPEISP